MTAAVSHLYPHRFREELMRAAATFEGWQLIERIDAITDELAKLGLCRPRSDDRTPKVAKGRAA